MQQNSHFIEQSNTDFCDVKWTRFVKLADDEVKLLLLAPIQFMLGDWPQLKYSKLSTHIWQLLLNTSDTKSLFKLGTIKKLLKGF